MLMAVFGVSVLAFCVGLALLRKGDDIYPHPNGGAIWVCGALLTIISFASALGSVALLVKNGL